VNLGGVRELMNRLAFENVQHARGFHYYSWQLPLGLLPAGLALPWMLRELRKPDPIPRTCALGVAIGVLVFSLSPSKQSHYMLPLYPLVAVWAGTSGVFARWRIGLIGSLVLAFSVATFAVDKFVAAEARGTTRRAIGFLGRSAREGPLAIRERHPLVAYYLDRPDLEVVSELHATVEFIEKRRGFVFVDLERGEKLDPSLERFSPRVLEADGHTYVLLLPPEKPDSRR
jgi:hypothetical protein